MLANGWPDINWQRGNCGWTAVLLVVAAMLGGLVAGGPMQGPPQPPAAGATPQRLPRDQLLLYRDAQGQWRQARSPDDWERRRAEIRHGMETIMGRLPGADKRCPLDVRIEEEKEVGSYVRQKITYQSEPGSRVPAYLLIPRAVREGTVKKAPAVLCLHPTDNTLGHGVVVGLGGKPHRAYAAELAERGFVTLAPNYPLLAQYQPDLKKLGWDSGTLKAVWDNIRGLDYLQSLPYVDGRSFGTIGHSLGGHNSIFTAVWDDRLKVIISSCGFDSFLDYYGGDERNWQPGRGWCQDRYMPKLAGYRGRLADIPFDFYELIAALAPRHVLIVAPVRDSNFQVASVRRIVAAARPVFALYQAEDRLLVEYPDADHDFPDAMRQKAYQLLEKVLRPAGQ
ncbi:MAG: prolyl oligopeptidase family serine peptidase [Gemmataceae bacterium]|nr:prolyl oligopeptidase family serine peptidase [Gemmataceae bacterium]MCS7270562.1 prolyl oligopeptidase family serine peptidase [Gemmataceae bacterium]MDW8244378.1 prolyl oligopeptidase family serine peptidase [Thermogemmata sp.]